MKTTPKESKPLKITQKILAFCSKKKFKILILALVSIFVLENAFIAALVYKSTKHPKVNIIIRQTAKSFMSVFKVPTAIKYKIKSSYTKPERLYIHIKHLDLQKLAYDRKIALDQEIRDFKYVKAKINYQNDSMKTKLRLKGDREVHYSHENQWSFRVHLKGKKTLLGMRSFSLHKPAARNYVHEWLFHQALQREGVISLRYKFVNVSLNGKDLGLYALEEHFDKLLLENNKRKEGPIVRFKEGADLEFQTTAIEPFKKKKWLAKDKLPLTQNATHLIDQWRKGKLSTKTVFDIEKLAKFFAITDLLGTHHGAVWKSLRFYYNPINTKLEPIGFDGHYGTEKELALSGEMGLRTDMGWIYNLYGDWFRFLFNDEKSSDREFIKLYNQELEKYSKKEYLDQLF